jgi:Protein of unknown function (DUF2973)
MLHLLYIAAFTVLAFLAVGNLIRNLMTLGLEQRRGSAVPGNASANANARRSRATAHPELLDAQGNMINEPLLVMRSMSVDDARLQLDAIFEASPGGNSEPREES